MKNILIITAIYCFAIIPAMADEYRPAYLELKQTGGGKINAEQNGSKKYSHEQYNVLWKVPAKGKARNQNLNVVFSGDINKAPNVRKSQIAAATIKRWTIQAPDGLAGTTVRIQDLESSSADVLVRIERLDGTTETARLNASETAFIVQGTPEFWQVANSYLVFGIEHILEGFDHLLFVACLIFIAGSWRRIFVTITGFTIAHSITLTLAALELVQIAIPPVEAVIALSIVFLAREIALDRRDTLTWRYPIAVSASFGLLHGFGFASALSDIGLPQTEIPAALLAFNIGVELGQLLFVATLMIVARLIRLVIKSHKIDFLAYLQTPAAYFVGCITMYWTLQRVSGFLI